MDINSVQNYRNLPSITLLRSLHIFQVDHNIFELIMDQDMLVWVISFESSWLRGWIYIEQLKVINSLLSNSKSRRDIKHKQNETARDSYPLTNTFYLRLYKDYAKFRV